MAAVRFHHFPRGKRRPEVHAFEGVSPQKKPVNHIKYRHDFTTGGGHSSWRNIKRVQRINSDGNKSPMSFGQFVEFIKRRIKNKIASVSRQKNIRNGN